MPVDARKPKIRPGPDRGWSWAVAMACFFINFIMAGLARSAGVLYVALIEKYGISRQAATTPFSIRVSVRNLTGPLVGMLGQRYGIRIITMSGGVCAAIGSMICFFAPDILWITLFWGVIHGFGFGLSTVLHMMTINQYFDKYKATALGLGYSGDCIGTLILPYIIESLLTDYGLQGALLVIGALVLNVVPLAMILRPPSWKTPTPNQSHHAEENASDVHPEITMKYSYENKAHTETEKANFCITQDLSSNATDLIEEELNYRNDTNRETSVQLNNDEKIGATLKSQDAKVSNGLKLSSNNSPCLSLPIAEEVERSTRTGSVCIDGYLPPPEIISCKQKSTAIEDLKKCENFTEIIVENLSQIDTLTATITEHLSNGNENIIKIRALSETNKDNKDYTKRNSDKSSSLKKVGQSVNSQLSNDKLDLPEATETKMSVTRDFTVTKNILQTNALKPCIKICYDKDSMEQTENASPTVEIGTTKSEHEVQILKQPVSKHNNFKTIIKSALKTNLKPMFLLISLTMASYVLLFISIMTVVVDFAQDKGVSQEDGKYLVISFSAADLVGRLGFGVVIDRRWIEMQHYAALCVGLMGLSAALIPFGTNLLLLALGMSIYGFIQGGVAIMYPILIDKYLDKNEESIGMGCLNFYAGLLMVAVAPMIGYFRDTYGSYDGMFYIVGMITLAVGLTWVFEPCIYKIQRRSNSTKNIQVQVICNSTTKSECR